MVGRWDLTYEEWGTLLRLYRHEGPAPDGETNERFQQLGLGDGAQLTEAGRRLVEDELLKERRNRLQR
jgi:hypothetical protein